MTDRGATRPDMGRMGERMHDRASQEPRRPLPGGHEHGMMDPEQRMHMLREHHGKTLWVYWMLVVLGVWMVATALSLSYDRGTVEPADGRSIWIGDVRSRVLFWSDMISGLLLIGLGWRSLTPNRPISLWAACFVGIWLNAAPLLFWAPNPAVYLNDTLVGSLVIALTILIPGMPNMIRYTEMGPEQPPGWSYNPSSWVQRSILIGLGLAGWLVSRYLAAYQLGYLAHPYDPFFGESTRRVLTSDVSRMMPISDAGLGALAYTFEFLMGWMGSPSRWRTMPWMVTLFGILVIPLGLVHIILVISQPVVVGAWCTLCLLAAAIMLPMIPLEVDEVVAMGQFLARSKRRGESLWKTFWKGGSDEGGGNDERSPAIQSLPHQPAAALKASLWGMSYPWNLVLSAGLGVWMMFVPWALGNNGSVADVDHLAGALAVTVAVIAMGEVVRALRYVNIVLGLLIAIWALAGSGATTAGLVNDMVAGMAIAALALRGGRKTESYGAWDRFVV